MAKGRMESTKPKEIEELYEHLLALMQKLDLLHDDIELGKALNLRDNIVCQIAGLLSSE